MIACKIINKRCNNYAQSFTKISCLNIVFAWNEICMIDLPTSLPKPCVSNNAERKLISLEIGGTHKNVNIVFNPRTLNSLIELFFPNIRGSFEQYDVLNSNSFYTYINQRSFTRATFHVHLKRTWGIIGTLRNKYYHKLHGRQHLTFWVYSEKRKK